MHLLGEGSNRASLLMDYTNFNVEDFASDEQFIDWVKGNCSEEEKEFWHLLALSNPHLAEKIERARALVVNVDCAEDKITPVDPAKVREIWQNLLAGIDDTSSVEDQVTIPKQRKNHHFVLAASITFIGLILTTILLIKFYSGHEALDVYSRNAPGFIEVVNDTDDTMHLGMRDGSVIALERNSRIRYKESYDADSLRKVYLHGVAFFKVARNPEKPFLVFTNNVATEVLGTSFRIKEDKTTGKVTVAVKTGKVSVYSIGNLEERFGERKKKGVILFPNQEVTYTEEEHSFEKKIVEAPEVLKRDASVNNFTFENTPVDSVFARLQNAYGIEIVFDREAMKNCFITVPLRSEPLFDKLRIICRTIGASYEVIDAKVVITGPGCRVVDAENENLN